MALTEEERALLFGQIAEQGTEQLASAIKREELTGDPRSPMQQAVDFVSDPTENLLKPASAASMDFISGLNTGIVGATQLGAEVATLPPVGVNWLLGEDFFTMEDREKFLSEYITQPELTRQKLYSQYREELTGEEPSSVATILGQIFPSLAVTPTKAAPTVVGRLMQSGKFGGISGGMEFTEGGSGQRASNVMIGTALGVPLQGIIDGGIAGKRFLEKARLQKLTVDSPSVAAALTREETQQVLEAAQRLGITVTPAEATNDLLLIHGQRQLNVNEATRGELAEFIMQRNDDLTENILKLQRVGDQDLQYAGAKFTPTGVGGGKARPPFLGKQDEVRWKKTRQEVYRKTLDQEELDKILQVSPLLQSQVVKYKAALKTKPTKRTDEQVLALESINKLKRDLGIEGDIPFNNVGFLDMLVDNLDQVLDKGADVTTAAGKKQRAIVQNQRKALSQVMKNKVSGYADMKAQGQRAKAVSMLRNAVDDTVPVGDYPKKFYDTVLKDKKKRDELVSMLKTSSPNAAQTVADLGLVMQHIFGDANIAKKITQTSEDVVAMRGGGGNFATAWVKLRSMLKKDEAMIRVLTDPRWATGIKDLKGRTPNETLMNLTSFLNTVTNTSNAIEKAVGLREERRQQKEQLPPRTSKAGQPPRPSRSGTIGLFGKTI
jgi:hypothetical protein